MKIADSLERTPPPTDRELDFIRHFAPSEVVGKETVGELMIPKFMREMEEQGKNLI